MQALTIRNFTQKILVVGPLYDQVSKLSEIEKIENKYGLIILNGNICFPSNKIEEVENRLDILSKKSSKYIYVLGNYDLELLSKTNSKKIEEFLSKKPNVVMIDFINQNRIIILNGGVKPGMNKYSLLENLEVSFISYVNDEPWHKEYGGGYGYIISNNPCTTEEPQFYKYSAQIGTKYQPNFKIYAQEADQYGLKETFLI